MKVKYGRCQLCERETHLTFHHLIPKKMHRRTRFKKSYTKEELGRGINVCRPCHSHLHRLYDEMTLGKQFNTLETLLADEAIQRHILYMKKRT